MTKPLMTRPVKSMGRAKGRANASWLAAGPVLTSKSPPITPQAMCPPIRKHSPPNIFCSVKALAASV